MYKYKFVSKSEEKTQKLAKKVMVNLKPGDVVLLTGDLGAGKTTFVGGALASLGYKDHVVSPTFNILKCYFEVQPNVFHIDAYRLDGQNIDIGLEEFIEGNGITFIEWPNFIEKLIPEDHITINIMRVDDTTRTFEITFDLDKHKDLYKSLR